RTDTIVSDDASCAPFGVPVRIIGAFCGDRLRYALIVFLFALVTNEALARCSYSDVYGDAFTKPENRLGEVIIKLRRPDYANLSEAKKHLVYSRVFGLLLSRQLPRSGSRTCDAVVTTDTY